MHSRTLRTSFKSLCLLIIGLVLWIGQTTAFAQVHLVIDVSGNIQRLDPQKKRIEAIQSFIHQLPEGTYTGIWTYAKGVNRLVNPGVVNEQWRRNALRAVSGIGGYGSYSNVGEALSQATYFWRDNNPQRGRNVVLITDSGLRASDNLAENQAARERLLNNLLPGMKNGGVKLYILAFDKADKSLYQTLAEDTQGGFYPLANLADLQPALRKLSSQLGLSGASAAQAKPAAKPAKDDRAVETKPKEDKPTVEKETESVSVTTSDEKISAEATVKEELPAKQNEHLSKQEVTMVNVAETPETTEIKIESTEKNAAKTVGVTTLVTEKEKAETSAAAVTPVLEEEETLGAEEAEEIRSALANAEAELSELLNEFATLPKNETSATSQVLNGQQSSEPLVITLADGSVLVTPNENKAQALNAPAVTNSAQLAGSIESMEKNVVSSKDAETRWSDKSSKDDIWPLILTILVVVNLVVILLLFVGRFLWLRYKRKKNNDSYYTR